MTIDLAKAARNTREHARERFKNDLDKCLADPEYTVGHPRPWTCAMVIHDGAGAQFIDANGKPVLTDLIRDPEDAAQLLFNINSNT